MALDIMVYDVQLDPKVLELGAGLGEGTLTPGFSLIPRVHRFSGMKLEAVVLVYLPPERCHGFGRLA
ncbi:MAG: hypothetical protein ACM31L_12640 [Actinomycetota bacterium]